jgi:phosphonate transport system substrate-binding protein
MGSQMAEQTNGKSGSLGRILVLLVVLALLMGAGAVGAEYLLIEKPLEARLAMQNDLLLKLSGLQNPTANKLDTRYQDANNDLIADVPSDPAKQLDPATIRFSFVAPEQPENERDLFAELDKAISDATGKPVEYVIGEPSKDRIRDMRDGKLQVAILNTGSVPLAVCTAGFVPIAALGNDKGATKYQMEILVRADSPVQSPSDLRNHEVTLTEPGSNSGYKAPLVILKRDFGLLPGRDFGIRYSGGHAQSIRGLADGTYEVIAVANDVLSRVIAAGEIKPAQFRSIYKSADYPTAAIGYANNLKPELAAKISEAILKFNWKGTGLEKAFNGGAETRFVPVDYKNDWALVRQIDDSIGFPYELN